MYKRQVGCVWGEALVLKVAEEKKEFGQKYQRKYKPPELAGFAHNVRGLMTARKIKVDDMALVLDVPRWVVYEYRGGYKHPEREHVMKIAGLMGLVDWQEVAMPKDHIFFQNLKEYEI